MKFLVNNGRILHFFFPLQENDFGYLYMYLGDQVDVEKTVLQKRKYLQVKECRMKGKVNKSLSSNWKTVG